LQAGRDAADFVPLFVPIGDPGAPQSILDEPDFRQTVLDYYAERLYGRLRAEHDQLGLPGAL
jgi:hypothetical protein